MPDANSFSRDAQRGIRFHSSRHQFAHSTAHGRLAAAYRDRSQRMLTALLGSTAALAVSAYVPVAGSVAGSPLALRTNFGLRPAPSTVSGPTTHFDVTASDGVLVEQLASGVTCVPRPLPGTPRSSSRWSTSLRGTVGVGSAGGGKWEIFDRVGDTLSITDHAERRLAILNRSNGPLIITRINGRPVLSIHIPAHSFMLINRARCPIRVEEDLLPRANRTVYSFGDPDQRVGSLVVRPDKSAFISNAENLPVKDFGRTTQVKHQRLMSVASRP